jgi:hypothetical protein
MGIDPKQVESNYQKIVTESRARVIVDPLHKRMEEIPDSERAALQLSKYGFDNYSNIALLWDYDSVQTAFEYIDIDNSLQEREEARHRN